MEEVGVLAVVEGLQSFISDMRSVNSAIDSLRPSGTFIGSMFDTLTGIVAGFGREILNVAEVTLGVLLRDAIDYIIGQLRDLAQAIIDAGNEFQLLQIRLDSLNLPANASDIKDWSAAMAHAKDLTKEQLTWIQQLAAATPFDPATIANVYTMARVFGQTDEEARRLTKDITNFGAGQALTNQDLTTTIQNFGQIIERGKIMGQTIRNLTRSAFLPWDDIVVRMSKDLGISKEKVIQLVSTAKGIPAGVFIKAFEEMVETEPRFIGAAGRLARALVPAINNVKEIGTSIFGLNVAVPIFDVLGERVASFTDQFVNFNAQGDMIKTDRWNALVTAATSLGQAIAGIVTEILGFLPTSAALADALVNTVQGLSNWVTEHRKEIVQFFKDVYQTIKSIVKWIRDDLLPVLAAFAKWVFDHREEIVGFFKAVAKIIKDTLAPFIKNILMPAFEEITKWIKDHKEEINEFFTALGNIITKVFNNLTGANIQPGQGLTGFLDTLATTMQWVIDNQDKIATLVTWIIRLAIALELLNLAFNIVIGIISFFAGIIASLIIPLAIVITILGLLAAGVSLLSAPVFAVIAGLLALGIVIGLVATNWGSLQATIGTFLSNTQASINEWEGNTSASISGWVSTTIGNIATWASNAQSSISTWIGNTIASISGWVSTTIANIRQWGVNFVASIGQWLETAKATMKSKFDQMVSQIKGIDWVAIGSSIIQGMIAGINSGASGLINAAVAAATAAFNAAMTYLQAGSPSMLFMGLGESTMTGMAEGIKQYAGLASDAMVAAMQQVAIPAMILPAAVMASSGAGNQYAYNTQNSNNYNLNIHTNADREPIIQDFNMLKSLAGG